MAKLIALAIFAAHCQGAEAELAYSNDFECSQFLADSSSAQRLIPADEAIPACAERRVRTRGPLGRVNIEFEDGERRQRSASVVADPKDSRNRVLEFWLSESNVRGKSEVYPKGRVQLDVHENAPIIELNQSVRVFLADGFLSLESLPRRIPWLTIAEWFNDPPWVPGDFPYRVTVDIQKLSANVPEKLAFSVRAEKFDRAASSWQVQWSKVNASVKVPVGRWVSIEYIIRDGDDATGRFLMKMEEDGKGSVTVFDINAPTRDPLNRSGGGFWGFNPIKLYTAEYVIRHAKISDGGLRIYWDDLKISATRR